MDRRSEEIVKQLPTGLLRWYPFAAGANALYVGDSESEMASMLMSDMGLKLETASVTELENISTSRGYDYIICVSGLEILKDIKGGLQKLKSLLDPSGIMLLGMNNRLGIRYFTGDKDPYTGQVFDGIENYSGIKDDDLKGRMFSKSEIEECLDEAGFIRKKFFSVLNDLDNPTFLFAEDYLPNEDRIALYPHIIRLIRFS